MSIPATYVKYFFYGLFLSAVVYALLQFFTSENTLSTTSTADVNAPVDLMLFGSDSCPHCKDQQAFLDDAGIRYQYFPIHESENRQRFDAIRNALGIESTATPFSLVTSSTENPTVLIGFEDAPTTGRFLLDAVKACAEPEASCLPADELMKAESLGPPTVTLAASCTLEECGVGSRFSLAIPFVGVIDFSAFALPVATIILGLIDGFNPCAMWVLVTLLTLLIALKDRTKLWLIGGTFIFVSGAIYYVFIALQGAVLGLLGINAFVISAIALLAIGAGLFYLYEFLTVDAGVCTVTNADQKRRLVERMQTVLAGRYLPLTLLGIAGIAISVNLIELACTAGLPVIFNGLLLFWSADFWMRQLYTLLYVGMYMLDDVLLFTIAVKTMQLVGFSGAFAKASNLIGGVLMILLGLLLLINPSLLSL